LQVVPADMAITDVMSTFVAKSDVATTQDALQQACVDVKACT
jgi:hypothetical protein